MSSEFPTPQHDVGNGPRPSPSKRGCFSSFGRVLLLLIILTGLLLPFTPYAGKLKRGIEAIIAAARGGNERIVTRDVPREVIKEVPVTKEVIKQVERASVGGWVGMWCGCWLVGEWVGVHVCVHACVHVLCVHVCMNAGKASH